MDLTNEQTDLTQILLFRSYRLVPLLETSWSMDCRSITPS